MAGQRDFMTIEGTVQSDSLDSICLSHRICIATVDGHTYEVEPSYVGLYLEGFEGHHVIARVQPITSGNKRSVVRIWGLTVLDRTPTGGKLATGGGMVLPLADSREQVLCELDVGGVDA